MAIAVSGGMCTCMFGTLPIVLRASSTKKVLVGGRSVLTMSENKLGMNLSTMSFGMCFSLVNPAVIKTPIGVIIPTVCVPQIIGTWIPTKIKVLAGGVPICKSGDFCICQYLGKITISSPGQFSVT